MSNSYPPAPPKRLMRSTSNRVIGGVCGGVADYLNMDANLVRILTVLISLFTGVPVILYIVALFVMPEDTSSRPSAPPPVGGPPTYAGSFSTTEAGTPAPAYSPYPGTTGGDASRGTHDPVWGNEGPPWEKRQPEGNEATPTQPVAPSSPEAPVVPPPAEGEQGQSGDKPTG